MSTAVTNMNRRRALKRFALGGALPAAGGGLYAWLIKPHWVAVTNVDLPIRGLGHLMRVCFNCRPEITVLRLRPAFS